MLRRTLVAARVARASPGLRAVQQTVCGPLEERKGQFGAHLPPSLCGERLAVCGSLSSVSTCPMPFQLRWRADLVRGGSGRGDSGGRGRGRGRTQGRGRGRGDIGRGSASTQRRGPVFFQTCQNVAELADLAHCKLDSMDNRAIASFWSALSRLLHKRSGRDPNLEEKLRSVIDITCDRMHRFQYRDLAQTSLGIAKTVSRVRGSRQYVGGDPRQILRDLLVKERQYLLLFDNIARSTAGMLNKFDARHLSNLIYSYGLVKLNPEIEGETLFNVVGNAAVKILHTFKPQELSNMLWAFVKVYAKNPRLFQESGEMMSGIDLGDFSEQGLANILWSFAKASEANPGLFEATGNHIVARSLCDFWPQDLSNIVWAYATAGEPHSELFEKVGDHVAGLDCLDSFKPQELSNTAWAFANAGVSYPELYKKIGDHIAGLDSLDSFKPQALSNTTWAFATAGESHPKLFKKIGDHVAGLKSLNSFKPQELSNAVWAYATAGVSHPDLFKKIGNHITGLNSLFASARVSHPKLFKKIEDHIAGLKSLDSFKPQEMSNIAWAYATARRFDSRLFEKLSTESVVKREHFKAQEVANFLWACAAVGHSDERLFSAFAPVIGSKLENCNEQELANIAWAYSVANLPSQDLFNKGCAGALASSDKEFSAKDFSQLHQWQLWQQELGSGIELPQSLQAKCRNAFTSQGYSESKLQEDVVDALKAAGLDLDEEVLLRSGYRIDALVKVGDGRKVAVEVDGPSHFIQRRPSGHTILKKRQVTTLDRIEVVSVPYWEWNELESSVTKQHYLREKLGCEETQMLGQALEAQI